MSTVETSRIWSNGQRISTSTRLLIHGSKCAREMLEDLKSTFTMYIYTMGTKAYAEEVKKILDPCGVIFGKRVLSRCDTPDLSIKLLSKLKLADTDTLIVDDTPEVWSEHRRNLLQIDRYTFFPLRADELCFFSQKKDEDGERNNLAFIHKTLQRVGDEHHNSAKMDCRDTLARLRRKILRGYRIYVDRDVHTGYAKWRLKWVHAFLRTPRESHIT
jgi:hypothetical protein